MNEPKWINVKERMPDKYVGVIVYGIVEKVNVGFQAHQARVWTNRNPGKYDDGWFQWLTPCDILVEDVTHWIPLPLRPSP